MGIAVAITAVVYISSSKKILSPPTMNEQGLQQQSALQTSQYKFGVLNQTYSKDKLLNQYNIDSLHAWNPGANFDTLKPGDTLKVNQLTDIIDGFEK